MKSLSSESTFSAESDRFRLFVAGVTDYAIYMLSPEGIVNSWNAGAQRFKGYTGDEIIGQHFSRFYTGEDRACNVPQQALQTAIVHGKFEDEGWRVCKDGSRFWASVVIDPIRDSDGILLGFAKITRDITERRKAADDLEKANAALFHSQKLDAIGKLTGGVAHDFNNLLSVIVNGVGVLQRRLQDPEDVRILEAMARAAGRGATLTQQLLTFARQQPLKQDNYNLNNLINSFEAVLRRASKGSVRFDLELASDLALVRVDAAQFEAVLLNLIVNARDATPEGGRITLRTGMVELASREVGALPAGAYVKVVVQDTGCGMTKETASRAIEPFFTTKPVGQGTGLGLSQTYGLVQQSGGDLLIESALAEGATVSLYLPALPDEGAAKAARVEVRDKALVVDDQEDVLDMAVELFRGLGYEVLSANNGLDALEILKRTPDIDVLFSDVMMPGMSGIQLGREARALSPKMKIILASGYAAPALRAENASMDQFGFITKPYTVSQILRQLRVSP